MYSCVFERVCVLLYEVKAEGCVGVRECGSEEGQVNKTTLNERFVLFKIPLSIFRKSLLSMNYQFDRRPVLASIPAFALFSSRYYRTRPRPNNRSVPIPSTGDASDSRIAPVRVCAARRCAAAIRRQPSRPESMQQFGLEFVRIKYR